jgi:hypothetical protein
MEPEFMNIFSALNLPDGWDKAATDYFQTREFLNHTEQYNPCKQRYYLLYRNGIFETGVVVYTLRLDLLTFLNIPSPIRMNMAGIPCSVSSGGIIGNLNNVPQLFDYMKHREKGLLLFLNLSSEVRAAKLISARTLPTILLTNYFRSWDEYLSAMKSSYRRRIRLLSSSFSEIRREKLSCCSFDGQMYQLYLEVLKRSKGKLETLSPEFFQNLPPNFSLTAFYNSEKLTGWYISSTFNDKYYFFLGGVDYQQNPIFNTYFNLLLNVVREGIEKGAAIIDLGQTAEIPKLRLGGKLVGKYMAGYHSNRVMRTLLKAGKGLLEYSAEFQETNVFKGESEF